ncbi:UNVERIFIED_CONTAM: protein SEEDLING PLASTID DEVELOPMENT 1 [Sesamum calycinum]|uniref:Protein SEEDLING PLASTID DEVELOPMENT 1 n=1 Tax=Sesamum calycinum TaxID=2727403 RepID=A0AAW2Q4E9_9LAMI
MMKWMLFANEALHDDIGGKHGTRDETLKIDDTIEFTDNISEADVLLALQSKLKKNSGLQAAAKSRGIPTYVSKTSSLAQITKAIQAVMSDYADGFEFYESEAKANDSEKN